MTIDDVCAHIEIRQALTRYCRGVDRGDGELIKSAFWPDALDQHGGFRGLGWELAERLHYDGREPEDSGQHHVTNVYIDLDGGHARVESYVLAFHPYFDEAGGVRMGIFAGRYNDLFECREGEWRIAARKVINDWTRDDVPGDIWARGSWQQGSYPRGVKGSSDPSRTMFPLL
jgi:hypothetical protein